MSSNRFEVLRDEPTDGNPWKKLPEVTPVPIVATIGRKLEGSLPDYDYVVELSRAPSRSGSYVARARLAVFEAKEHARIAGQPRRSDLYYGSLEELLESFTRALKTTYVNKARWDVKVMERSYFLNDIAKEIEKLF